jgi:hypothetical protein
MLVDDDGEKGGGSLIPNEDLGNLNEILSLSSEVEDRTQKDAMVNADMYSVASISMTLSNKKKIKKGGQLQSTKLEASGVRAEILNKTCKKFESYDKLEVAMRRDLSKPIDKSLIESSKKLQQEKRKKKLEESVDVDVIPLKQTNSLRSTAFEDEKHNDEPEDEKQNEHDDEINS